jgi:death-on-curing protein
MGEAGQGLTFPTRDNIVRLNREHIHRTGGNRDGAGRFLNENSLEWVLEAIQHPLFGQDLYPAISQKAAILAWTIINGHVFLDGNKRTGMSAMMIFLRLNGFLLVASDEVIIEVAIRVATARESNYSQEAFMSWVSKHMELLLPPPIP